MSSETVVSDASTLIALDRIGRLDILASAYELALIPPAVRREIGPGLAGPPWIVEHSLTRPIDPRIVAANLGAGESEAISLAIDLQATQVILDDEPARKLAMALEIPLIGTLGVLLAAKRAGILTVMRPTVDALVATGFRLDSNLLEMVLAKAGEH